MCRFLLCALLAVCSGCAKDHAKPPANLNYVSVERESFRLYAIRYQSDVDVLDLFNRGEGVGMASGTLECALADDHDFSVDKAMQFSAVGLIDSDVSKREKENLPISPARFWLKPPATVVHNVTCQQRS